MKQGSFVKEESLKKNSLISDVFKKGTSFKGRFITVFLLKRASGAGSNRAAFTSRKYLHNGKNVLRNRFRRLLRESYRKTKHLLPPGYDIVILGTNFKKHTKSTLIEKEMADVFKKCVKK